jgi:BIM1-like copper acquisition factor
VLIPQDRIRALDFAHVCIDLPTLPSAAVEGRNATIRLRYVAEYLDPNHSHDRRRHLPVNETFYSCADVTLMARDEFFRIDDIPCFNATGDFDAGHSHDEDDEAEVEEGSDDDKNSGLSKGVIATALWYFIRRDRREKQMVQRMTAAGEGKSIAE